MRAIITGITGQDGAYLAKLLLTKGYEVIGVTRGYDNSYWKLRYLNIFSGITIEQCDLMDFACIVKLIKKYNPNEIYNLSAQSSVALSFEQPIGTMQYNLGIVLNMLEAIRMVNPEIKFYQASSGEMYGKVERLPINENTAFNPISPYAISKVATHMTVNSYRNSYGILGCCGILFNHESFLRSEGFFMKKIIGEAVLIKKGKKDKLTVGNIDIKRDFGFAPQYIEAIYLMMQNKKLKDYIVCSGKSYSLRSVIAYVFDKLGIDENRIVIDKQLYRPAEITDIYGDNSQVKGELGWKYDMNFYDVLDIIIDEELNFGRDNK